MMLWGIIGAMDQEVALLLEQATDIEEVICYGCTYTRATLEGQRVVLVCCGVGKVNAAICAMTLINQFKVDQIVHVGIAGSLSAELHCLDTVVATEALYHDISPGWLLDYFPRCEVFQTDPALVKLVERACTPIAQAAGHRIVVDRLVSGDQFILDPLVKQDLHEKFGAACVEMEGAAVAHVAFVHKIPFVILRIISDSLGSGEDAQEMEYTQFKPLACAQSSQMVFALLREAGK